MDDYVVKAQVGFEAWPEMSHAAKSVRKIARETVVGHNHVVRAAVALTAFSVEAFIQTIGPMAYGDAWIQGEKPAEKKPLDVKLKHIGRFYGVKISYGERPWTDVKRLIAARNRLAHPKPGIEVVSVTFKAKDSDDARQRADAQLQKKLHPLHDIELLDEVAERVEAALLAIWIKAGRSPHALKGWRKGMATVSRA